MTCSTPRRPPLPTRPWTPRPAPDNARASPRGHRPPAGLRARRVPRAPALLDLDGVWALASAGAAPGRGEVRCALRGASLAVWSREIVCVASGDDAALRALASCVVATSLPLAGSVRRRAYAQWWAGEAMWRPPMGGERRMEVAEPTVATTAQEARGRPVLHVVRRSGEVRGLTGLADLVAVRSAVLVLQTTTDRTAWVRLLREAGTLADTAPVRVLALHDGRVVVPGGSVDPLSGPS